MKIAAIQTRQYGIGVPQSQKEAAARSLWKRSLEETFELMTAAVRTGADLLVTIECLNQTGFQAKTRAQHLASCEPLDGPLVKRFSALARQHRVYVVAGLLTRRKGRAYNSAILFDREGQRAGLFDKVHLPAGEDLYVTPGNRYPVFQTEAGNIGMLICWDMTYPEATSELALGGADLIVCPTWGWKDICGACHAYENSVTIAAAMGVCGPAGEVFSCCDPSCIVNPMGEIVAAASRTGPQFVTAEIDIRAELAPQCGAGEITGMTSQRQIRLSERRPDTYSRITAARPPLCDRYDTLIPGYRKKKTKR